MAEVEELHSFIREEFAKQTETLREELKGLSLEIAQLGAWCPEDMEVQRS